MPTGWSASAPGGAGMVLIGGQLAWGASGRRGALTARVVLTCWLSTMPRKLPALLLALMVILVLAVMALLVLFVGRTPPTPPLPSPNGYDDFMKAAGLLTGDVSNASALDHDSLRALMSTNSESLRLLRLGLTRGCSMPTDSAMTNMSGLLSDLANSKSLVRLFEEQGRLAEMENRYRDAAHSYVDAIRFGNEIGRGGFIINRLVGIACEMIGEHPLSGGSLP